MRKPLEINALSRTTRGEEDTPVYVCSDCGTDEGFEDMYSRATPQSDWPLTARTYGRMIGDMHRSQLESTFDQ